MEASLHNDASRGKRKGSTLDRDVNKRQKVVDRQELDFLKLPNEIIQQIAQHSEALAALLLSLTCKRIFKLLNNDNRLWHAIYLNEQRIRDTWIQTKAFIDNTDEQNKGIYSFELESESLWFDGQYPLTADCLDFANEVIADEDKSYREYRPLLVGRDGEPVLQFPTEDMSFREYANSVNYKKLALQSWKRYYQYQFWSTQKKCARLWKYKHCSCFELDDLQMTNEQGEKIVVGDTDEDEFASHSDESEGHEEDQEISTDNEPTNDNSALTEEICSSFIEEISVINDLNFKLFVQLLDGVILGQCASPGCKHSYQIRVAKLLNKNVHLVVESGIIFQQIRRAISNKNSFECMSSITCALQKFNMTDLLTLQDCIKQKFPYLATLASILDIEESIPYFWITWMEYETAHWSFHIQPDLASVDDHNNMPDWLSIRHSMLKLMRRSGIFMATPNTSEYAVDALSSFIRRVLQATIELKPDGPTHLEVTATTIMQAVKSISKDKEHSATTLYSTCAETMQDDSIVMHVDSEISSEDSDFEDPSEEDDLNENLMDNEVIEDDDEKIDNDYQGLNELIKKSASGISLQDDETPLLMQTAVTYAQKDLPEGQMSDIIGEEVDILEEQEYEVIVSQDSEFQHIDVFSPIDIDDVLKINHDNLVLFHQQDAAYYKHRIQDFPKEFNLDLPFNKLTDDQRTKIIELRRETNKILKEEADKELKEEQIRSVMRREDNQKQYFDNRPDPLTCKSMEIKLNSTGATLQKTITDAIDIISNSKVLKLVRLKWVWLEEWEEDSNDELYDSLLEVLSKCSTLKTVELDECHLDQKLIRKQLPNVTVKLL